MTPAPVRDNTNGPSDSTALCPVRLATQSNEEDMASAGKCWGKLRKANRTGRCRLYWSLECMRLCFSFELSILMGQGPSTLNDYLSHQHCGQLRVDRRARGPAGGMVLPRRTFLIASQTLIKLFGIRFRVASKQTDFKVMLRCSESWK